MALSAIEKELVGATGFEPTKNYERQDYLAALARAVNEIEEDAFDGLSVEAQEWFNTTVRALNKKQELPDFPDGESVDDEDDSGPDGDDTEDDGPSNDEDEPVEEAPPPKAAKSKAPRKPAAPKAEKEVDRFGAGVKTQNHQALAMFEKGCRMGDVTEKVGGTYYNLLKAMVRAGHKVEKKPNGIIIITHMDELIKKGRKKK